MHDAPKSLSELAHDSSSRHPQAGGTDNPSVLVLDGRTDRRMFLARASALSLAIPGMGAALAACSGDGGRPADSAKVASTSPQVAPGSVPQNANSRLDTAVMKGVQHGNTTSVAGDASSATFHRYPPELPPVPGSGIQRISWHAREVPVRISADTVVAAWTFEGDVPGPIVHTRVGDTVEFTLTNDAVIPHSMDFHAAQIDPKIAFRSVGKGQSVSFTFKPKFAGAFMYHCGTAPVLMHIGSGMYGAIIVSPREPLAPAREFVLVQSEYYLGGAAGGARPFDYTKMLSTLPDFVTFNGRPNQYMDAPIRVKTGERVRFWLVNAGPTHPCNFHVVGEQFDTMYLGAPPGSPIRGVQTWGVAPGGGMVFELLCDVPGEFPFVNHGFGHGQKGAVGILVVE
jgi:nitrite reductase (NO-forming)